MRWTSSVNFRKRFCDSCGGTADEFEPDTVEFLQRLIQEPIWISADTDFQAPHVQEALQADLIIDAIAGDSKPPLSPLYRKVMEAVNNAFGISSPWTHLQELTLIAHSLFINQKTMPSLLMVIIAFAAPRPAHVFGELSSGAIAVSELGVQPAFVSSSTQVQAVTGQEVGIAFPPRLPDAHKGNFGHVLVIAGSAGKAGAAALAGMAALRTGAGLVTVACPKSIQAIVAGFAPEIMTEALPETETGSIASAAGDVVDRLMAGKNVVVLGPGLSQHGDTAEFVRALVQRCPLPLVLDADGINAFSGRAAELKTAGPPGIFRALTPHPGEAARLLGVSIKEVESDRIRVAQRIAAETGSCIVLKGWRTVVAGLSGETWINMTGNAAMAKGGSGDVLSGMIGAALARQAANSAAFLKDVSVAAAVHLHGITGDLARDDLHENTVIARDLMENLSEAFHKCELEVERGLFYLQK